MVSPIYNALRRYSWFGMMTLALASLLILGGCADSQASRELTNENAANDTGLSDEMEEIVVKRAIADDPQLPYEEISVVAGENKNQIVLGGMVPSEKMKKRLVEVVHESNPNIKVVNQVKVIPEVADEKDFTNDLAAVARQDAIEAGDKLGSGIEDAWIYSKIKSKLVLDQDTPARFIHVDVNHGNVTLRGTVFYGYARAEADRIARSTEGVQSVDDQIMVDNEGIY